MGSMSSDPSTQSVFLQNGSSYGYDQPQYQHGTTSGNGSPSWLFDSRASHHLTNNLSILSLQQQSHDQNGILVGNGTQLPIAHTEDNNCSITFGSSGFYIQDNLSKQILLRGPTHQGLYPLSLLSESFTRAPVACISTDSNKSQDLWHKRLGHLSEVLLSSLMK